MVRFAGFGVWEFGSIPSSIICRCLAFGLTVGRCKSVTFARPSAASHCAKIFRKGQRLRFALPVAILRVLNH